MRRAIALGVVLPAVVLGGAFLLSWSAPAQNTTTTTSTESHTTITSQLATFRYDEYRTRVTARMGAGPALYDQTFPVRFSDPSVQAAVATATAALQGAGAVAIQGPTLISSQTTFLGTTSTFQDTVIRSTPRVFTTTFTGPLCIGVGNRERRTFRAVSAGRVAALTRWWFPALLRHPLSHRSRGHRRRTTTLTEFFVNRQITEIDKFPTQAHYDLVGQQALVEVPALGAGGLAALGGLLAAAALIALRARA